MPAVPVLVDEARYRLVEEAGKEVRPTRQKCCARRQVAHAADVKFHNRGGSLLRHL